MENQAGWFIALFDGLRPEGAAMDFSISADLVSLKRNLRHLVETELKPHDAAIEEQGEIPPKALDAIRAFGLYGSNTPQRYGGLGLDILREVRAIRILEGTSEIMRHIVARDMLRNSTAPDITTST